MTGVARLAADDRVLQIDEPEEQQVIAQRGSRLRLRRETDEEAVRAARVAGHRRDRVRVQALLDRSLFDDRLLLLLPHHRAVARRRHVHPFHRRVAAGIFAEELVPDVEAGRDVPHALQERQQLGARGEERAQRDGRPQAEDRVVVVHERDRAVAHVDVTGHVDERRLRLRHRRERIGQRAPLAPHHLEEEIGRAGLVALEDGFGQLGDGSVGHDALLSLRLAAETVSPSPSRQPLDVDQTGGGERPELWISGHDDAPVVARRDGRKGVRVRDRETGLDLRRCEHRRANHWYELDCEFINHTQREAGGDDTMRALCDVERLA